MKKTIEKIFHNECTQIFKGEESELVASLNNAYKFLYGPEVKVEIDHRIYDNPKKIKKIILITTNRLATKLFKEMDNNNRNEERENIENIFPSINYRSWFYDNNKDWLYSDTPITILPRQSCAFLKLDSYNNSSTYYSEGIQQLMGEGEIQLDNIFIKQYLEKTNLKSNLMNRIINHFRGYNTK